METEDQLKRAPIQLQRAKHRFNALLGKRATLAMSGKSDSFIEDEVRSLEREFPELVSVDGDSRKGADDSHALSPPQKEKIKDVKDDVNRTDACLRSLSLVLPAQPSSQARLRKSAPPSLFVQLPPQPPFTPPPRLLSANVPLRLREGSHKRQVSRNNYFMIMFALQLFEERHQKSMMTRLSVVAIAILSVAAAAAHCTVVNPASLQGSLLSPSLLTLLVHANLLCGVYVRRKRRFTAPMLVVYTVFDIFPSLGLGVVCYNLGLIALEFHGFRRASSGC